MKRNVKRILSALLAVLMVAAMVSGVVFAAEPSGEPETAETTPAPSEEPSAEPSAEPSVEPSEEPEEEPTPEPDDGLIADGESVIGGSGSGEDNGGESVGDGQEPADGDAVVDNLEDEIFSGEFVEDEAVIAALPDILNSQYMGECGAVADSGRKLWYSGIAMDGIPDDFEIESVWQSSTENENALNASVKLYENPEGGDYYVAVIPREMLSITAGYLVGSVDTASPEFYGAERAAFDQDSGLLYIRKNPDSNAMYMARMLAVWDMSVNPEPVRTIGESDELLTDPGIVTIASGTLGDKTPVMLIQWQGHDYQIKRNSNYTTDDGLHWECAEDGTFTLDITESGTLKITRGKAEYMTVELYGGGGGGNSGYFDSNSQNQYGPGNGAGGSGGAGGQKVTEDVTNEINKGNTITITIGQGGIGGQKNKNALVGIQGGANGSDGGNTTFIGTHVSLTALGGKGGGGAGAPYNDGDGYNATGNNDGGGGGSSCRWYETKNGNSMNGYDSGDFNSNGRGHTCFNCGQSTSYIFSGAAGWDDPPDRTAPVGGSGNGYGGKGGSPANWHCGGDPDGQNGVDGYGGGGGGGAACTQPYHWSENKTCCIHHAPTGSAQFSGYLGSGGYGGKGGVHLIGKLKPGVELKLVKVSANATFTDGNSCYSLAGAVYGIYRDARCTDLIEQGTTNAQGHIDFAESYEPGTYYLKEITASTGYLLDTVVHTITVSEDLTVTQS